MRGGLGAVRAPAVQLIDVRQLQVVLSSPGSEREQLTSKLLLLHTQHSTGRAHSAGRHQTDGGTLRPFLAATTTSDVVANEEEEAETG